MKCRDMSKERKLILFAIFLFFSFISLTQEASSRALVSHEIYTKRDRIGRQVSNKILFIICRKNNVTSNH